MPAPIFKLLADELGISEQKTQKLLSAMLREVKKRARSGGVRLPDFGKFKDQDGELIFEPSESLARAVNHRFEGLSSEDLQDAPGQEEEKEEEDTGPSTITLGYQDSGWSPLDSEEDGKSDESEEDDGADTEEFQVPDAESAADTDELDIGASQTTASSKQQVEDPRHEEPTQTPPTEPDSSSQTEELYPLVEDDAVEEERADTSTTSERSKSDDDAERDHLSGIWSSDPDNSTETTDSSESGGAALDDIPTDPGAFDKEPPSDDRDSDSEDQTAESPLEDRQPAERQPKEPSGSGSSTSRVLVSLLVLLFLGGGAWYILGQQGTVPPPGPKLAQLQTQARSVTQSISAQLFASQSSDNTTSPTEQHATDASAATTAQGSTSSTAQGDGATSSEATGGQQSTTTPSGIDPSAGGWSIIVASRTDRAAASSLADTYRKRFAGQGVAVDVIPGNVNNSTRFRVGVGQFPSQTGAQDFLSKFGSELPDGAWALRLE